MGVKVPCISVKIKSKNCEQMFFFDENNCFEIPWALQVVKYQMLCVAKIGAKTTGPNLFKLTQKLKFKPEYSEHENIFWKFQNSFFIIADYPYGFPKLLL